MKVIPNQPRAVEAHRLPHNYDMATHEFCTKNFMLCRYNPSGTITITIAYGGGDSRVLTANVGDWIVVDNGIDILDPSVFMHRYSFAQEIAA